MNVLVFADSFLLIFVGVGVKGDQGIAFGMIYGLIGGLAAIMMFDAAIVALIMLTSKDTRPESEITKPVVQDPSVKKPVVQDSDARAKI